MEEQNKSIVLLSFICTAYGLGIYLLLTLPVLYFVSGFYFLSAVFSFIGCLVINILFTLLNFCLDSSTKNSEQFYFLVSSNALISTLLVIVFIIISFVGFDEFLDFSLSPLALFPLAGIISAILGVFANKKYILKNFSNPQNSNL